MLARALPWLLLAALALAGLQTYRLAVEQGAHARTQRDHARTQRDHAQQLGTLERAATEAVTEARDEGTRRFTALWEILNETQADRDRARADAAGAADAGVRLRQRIATLTAGCRPAAGDSAPAGSSPSADTTADLLADVQRRLDEAADGIARHADEAHIAGRACERAYDALNGTEPALH